MADEWHYAKNGNQHGPVSPSELKELVASGQLAPSDLIWKEGMDNWKPVSSVKGLLGEKAAKVPPPLTTSSPHQSQQNVLQRAIHWCTYPLPSFVPQPLPFETAWSTDERLAPNLKDFVAVIAIVLGGFLVVAFLTALDLGTFAGKLILFCMVMGIGLPLVFFRSSMSKSQLAGRWVSQSDQGNWTELSKGGTFRRSDGSSGTWEILRNVKFVDFISLNAPIDSWKILKVQPGLLEAVLEIQNSQGVVTKFKRHPLDDAISNVFNDPTARPKMLVAVWLYAENNEHWCQFTDDGAVVTSQGPAGRYSFSGEQPNEVISMELADGRSNSWKVVSLTQTQLVVAEDGQTMILRKSGAPKAASDASQPSGVLEPDGANQPEGGAGEGFLSKVWSFMTKHKCPKCNQRAGVETNREPIDRWQDFRSVPVKGADGQYRQVQKAVNHTVYRYHCQCKSCNHQWNFDKTQSVIA